MAGLRHRRAVRRSIEDKASGAARIIESSQCHRRKFLSPVALTGSLVLGTYLIGLITIPMHYAILKRLLAIVDTVRAGDPFVAANASRLQVIAWVLLAQQLLSMTVGAIAKAVSTPAHPLHLDAGFSVNGWLVVLLTFLLAQVFAEGTRMREDLEGTV